jgi:drug/metabolite transporter (DMT)-like permease
MVAGIGFGLFFILLHAGSAAGITAFVFGRSGSAVAAICFALVTRVSFIPRRPTWRLVGIAGSFDGVGVVLYIYATFHGLLSLSALLTSFYPAFTVLCARLLTRERMSRVQALGAALAVGAVVLIAAT